MIKTTALTLGAAVVFTLADAPRVEAQYATVIETEVPAQKIPPPAVVRGREHRAAKNPYFGLRSSYPSVRRYYSNPVKTIPGYTKRTIIYHGGFGYPNYGGYPFYPYRYSPGFRYQYGYPWGFRR